MPVTGFLAWQSAYFAKAGHFRSLVSSGGFSKKPTAKFAFRKKVRRKKTRMAEAVKSCHQGTGYKKAWPKREWLFHFKIFKYE